MESVWSDMILDFVEQLHVSFPAIFWPGLTQMSSLLVCSLRGMWAFDLFSPNIDSLNCSRLFHNFSFHHLSSTSYFIWENINSITMTSSKYQASPQWAHKWVLVSSNNQFRHRLCGNWRFGWWCNVRIDVNQTTEINVILHCVPVF